MLTSFPKTRRSNAEKCQRSSACTQKTPKLPSKCLNFHALCQYSRFAYYTESNAIMVRLALPRGHAAGPGVHAGGSLDAGKGLHSFTLELNASNSRTLSLAKSGYTVDRRAQVELNWE